MVLIAFMLTVLLLLQRATGEARLGRRKTGGVIVTGH